MVTKLLDDAADLGDLLGVAGREFAGTDVETVLEVFLQLIYGILGGIGPDLDNLIFMKRTADRLFGNDYLWSVLAGGRHQINFCTAAAMMGGNVRVGLEDSLYIGPGKLAASNAEQVAKIRRIVEELGYQAATPAEARQMLGLKGADKVQF